MGATKKSGPIFIISSGDISYQNNPMYQISANSDEKRAKEMQNTENWGVNVDRYIPSSNLTCLQTKDNPM